MKKIFVLYFIIQSHCVTAAFLPQAFEIEFEQSYKSVTGKDKVSKGNLKYAYPGKLRIEEFKNNTLYVSNGEKSWYYTPAIISTEKGTVQISKSTPVMAKLFDSLQSGIKSNTMYEVSRKEGYYLLSFTDTARKELGLKQVHLFLKKQKVQSFSDISKMELVYDGDDHKLVKLNILKLQSSPKFQPSVFQFTVTKGMRSITDS